MTFCTNFGEIIVSLSKPIQSSTIECNESMLVSPSVVSTKASFILLPIANIRKTHVLCKSSYSYSLQWRLVNGTSPRSKIVNLFMQSMFKLASVNQYLWLKRKFLGFLFGCHFQISIATRSCDEFIKMLPFISREKVKISLCGCASEHEKKVTNRF